MTLIISPSLGILGGLFILLSYLYFPQSRKPSSTLIVLLSIYDIGTCAVAFLSNGSYELCMLQAFLQNFFQLGGIFMTVLIADFLHDLIINRKHPSKIATLQRIFAVNIASLALSCLPFTTGNYGDTGSWCGITQVDNRSLGAGLFETSGIWWRFVCFYFPLWLSVGYNIYIYRTVLEKITHVDISHFGACAEKAKAATIRLLKKLRWYPRILAACYLPTTVLRLVEVFNSNRSPEWLQYFAANAFFLLGLFNAAAYGYSIVGLWHAELKSWANVYPWLRSVCCCVNLSNSGSVDEIGRVSNNTLSSHEHHEAVNKLHTGIALSNYPSVETPSGSIISLQRDVEDCAPDTSRGTLDSVALSITEPEEEYLDYDEM